MNNKIIARIMAAVICVCMMSTVAFAADPTLTVDGDTATLSFVVGGEDITVSDEAQITMMAYLVDATAETVPDYTNQTVIALDQVAGSEGFGEVLVAASKLEADKKIAVVLGGSDGTTEKFLIAIDEETGAVEITVEYELNGGALAEGVTNAASFTSETVAAFLAALNAPAKADLVVDTETETTTTAYTFAGWFLDAECTVAATAETLVAGATAVTMYAKWTDETTSVPKAPAVEKVVVTFMNGGSTPYQTVEVEKGSALDLTAITAPTFTADPQYTGYVMVDKKTAKFTFAGWVDASDKDVADGTVVSEDITLTAKYDTGIVYGDSNADGSANNTDISGVVNFYKNKTVSRNHYTGKPIYPGIVNAKGAEIVAGDSNGDGSANNTDISGIVNFYKNKNVSRNHFTGQKIYFINK